MKVCGPAASEPYDALVGVLQSVGAAPSSWHRTVEIASLVENVNKAAVDNVALAGFDEIVTSIGTGSRAIAVNVPVAVGPPGWPGKGG